MNLMSTAVSTEPVLKLKTVYDFRAVLPAAVMNRLCAMAEEHSAKAGQAGFIKAYPSGVTPAGITAYEKGIIALAIDFGGTKVKCIAAEASGDGINLEVVKAESIDSRNNLNGSSQHSIAASVEQVIRKLDLSETQKSQVRVVSIVYSNAADPVQFKDGDVTGLTAVVPSDFNGGIKREGFMSSVQCGDDIGKFCLEELRKAGFNNIRILRCDNDTISTANVPPDESLVFPDTSLPVKVGGVVASTGANFTIYTAVDGGELSELSNSEGGNHFRIPAELLPEHLRAGFGAMGVSDVSLERLCGRINLTEQFFMEVHKELRQKHNPVIFGITQDDRKKIFDHKDAPLLVAAIVRKDQEGFLSLLQSFGIESPASPSDEEFNNLQMIANGIGRRSAQVCALMCYTSATNCLDSANYIANLDASMAGIFPNFVEDTQMFVRDFVNSRGRRGKILVNHMPPADNFSIPIQGGFRIVLEQFHSN